MKDEKELMPYHLTANGKLTTKTLVPLGVLAVVAAGAWHLSAERQKALADIGRNTAAVAGHDEAIAGHDEAIAGLAGDLEAMRDSLTRIELYLGTAPDSPFRIPHSEFPPSWPRSRNPPVEETP